jgi:hypothetical protein
MMFEKTLPAGTASFFHLHPDNDKVACVRAGEFTFMIGDKVTVGRPGDLRLHAAQRSACLKEHWQRNRPRPVYLHTRAAGGLIEELSERRSADTDERNKFFERHRWKGRRPKPTLTPDLRARRAGYFAPDFCTC